MQCAFQKEMKSWVGDEPNNIRLALFAHASFASWLNDSTSATGAFLCLMGPRTYAPLSWFGKKRTTQAHSSTESELVALDAALRVEGLPALTMWDTIIDIFNPEVDIHSEPNNSHNNSIPTCYNVIYDELSNLDHVPKIIPESSGRAKLVFSRR